MSIKEKIENNLTVFFLGALFTGFLFGLGTYKSIVEIANLDTVRKGSYVKKEDISKNFIDKEKFLDLEKKYNRLLQDQSSVILQPKWVYENNSISIISGQILLNIIEVDIYLKTVTFEINTPSGESTKFAIKKGKRGTFDYKQKKYIIDVLAIDEISTMSFRSNQSALITIVQLFE